MPRLAVGGLKPRLTLSWYENHKTEKALALGIHDALPETEHAGFFCMLPSPNYLAPLQLPSEAAFKVLPGRLICCGKEQESIFKTQGAEVPLGVGAALRYRHVWDNDKLVTTSDRKNVLIALPNLLVEATAMIELVGKAAEAVADVESWQVKPHADYDAKDLLAAVGKGRWPQNLKLVDRPISEQLERSGAVISGGSGTLIEAACRGIPVVFIGSLLDVDFNPLAWFEGFGAVCRTPDEVADAVHKALDLDPSARERLLKKGMELRERCFEKISDQTLSSFLGTIVPPKRSMASAGA